MLAPPGSGKTKLLTTRLAYDLFNTIPPPHGAACITLTRPAADELRHRLHLLGTPERSTLFVGTVHSFALRRIIAPFAGLVGRPEFATASIATTQQVNDAFKRANTIVFGPDGDTRARRVAIDYHRTKLSDDAEWAASGVGIRDAAVLYEQHLLDQGLIDFSRAIATAVDLVEQHELVRTVLAARHPRLYVDEYQDLAPGLHRLVRALCFDYSIHAELFAVGDPDQAVYGWTGTRPELLDELAATPGVMTVRLDHNYRSRNEIIRVANLLRQGAHHMVGDRAGGAVIATRYIAGFRAQCDAAAQAAQDAHKRGVLLHDIVALCATNAQCRQVAQALRDRGIPATVRSTEYGQTLATTFVEACAAWSVLGRENSSHSLGTLLKRWRQLLGSRWQREDDVRLTTLLMNSRRNATRLAQDFLNELLDLGLREGFESVTRSEDAAAIADMSAALTSGPIAGLTVHDLSQRARKLDRVEVTTMTLSKGLEFDLVLILGMDERQMPHFNSFDSPTKMAEDRRKFYVSVTRARDEVQIFCSGYVQWSNGNRSCDGPSRFLAEIGLYP
ncbi:ATP-dependent helicase [Allokutzneria sp. A3M-2-11 16]|nr:ATP-dependent helicase [Allokutzneria sp. A3M-2-11 16]